MCPSGIFGIVLFSLLGCCVSAAAIQPDEVLVIANKRVNGSVELARYYMEKRKIPSENLLVLKTLEKEEIRRSEYDRWIRKPIRKKLAALEKKRKQEKKLKISTLVTVYGVPLKITETSPQQNGKKRSSQQTTKAAVDSELALVELERYELSGWVANPYFLPLGREKNDISTNAVLLVSRLDAPSPELVRRMIDDAVAVEKEGLKGRGYFDARGLVLKGMQTDSLQGYESYDYSILRAAEAVKEKMTVVVDNEPQLFAVNSCPDAALYCGWYSYGKYIDSFSWKRGAVGFHIASAECASLHREGAPYWCPQLIAHGVAATVGPVYEPFVQGFPVPEIFFGMLTRGMTIGEAYLVSQPVFSWQMVLLGDPLYQPFR